MILISILLICVTNSVLIARMDFQRFLDLILANFLLVSANIILTFEITSLLGWLSLPWAFLGIQTLWASASWITFRVFKNFPAHTHRELIKETFQRFAEFCRRNKGFTAYLAVILIAYLCLTALSIIYPQNTTDSLYNHLSRIGHWLQQGSLKPYDSFNNFGITYPYNNSLLMMWFILFTRTDRLVGLVQWTAALLLSLSIYGLSTELKFSKKQAGFSALIFLTFPIVLLQSTTAQNDILVACFFLIGVYLFIRGFQFENRLLVLFSALGIALAVGTKQYLAFAVPGFLVLFLYFVFKKEIRHRIALSRDFLVALLGLTLLFGSYTYIQNTIYFQDPTGNANNLIAMNGSQESPVKKLAFTTARLATQFISCDGLPLPAETGCLSLKGKLFTRIYSNPSFNLESTDGLIEKPCGSTCYSFSTSYPLNEESSWFGFLSWILILPGSILAVVYGIRRKEPLQILVLLVSLLYFVVSSLFLMGWNAYMGRYFIMAVALLMPFTGYLLADRTWWQKVFTILFTLMSVFILVYTILGNDSKPLLTKQKMVQVQLWGKNHSLLVTKVAYKLTPWFKEQISYLDFDRDQLRVFATGETDKVYPPTYLIKQHIPVDSSVGIVANPGMVYDYLFFGEHFTRTVYDIPFQNDTIAVTKNIHKDNPLYLLVYPDIQLPLPANYHRIDQYNNYLLYQSH